MSHRCGPRLRSRKRSGYVDTIGAEDTRMNARLKNICRGRCTD
jgi:hypothetical protein